MVLLEGPNVEISMINKLFTLGICKESVLRQKSVQSFRESKIIKEWLSLVGCKFW